MEIMKSTRINISNSLLARQARGLARQRLAHTLDTASNVGVIIAPGSREDFRENRDFLEYLAQKSLNITILLYINDLDDIPYYQQFENVNYFTSKDLNWLYRPKSSLVLDFIKEKYDILIDLSLEPTFPVKYITGMSRAKFKVGLRTKENPYFDLMLDLGNLRNRNYYNEQLKYYLNILKN